MSNLLERSERRKHRDPDIRVWDCFIRSHHWLLALAFATLYLEYKKFPLHPYAGYVICIIVPIRIIWGFAGKGAARFSSFWYSPREILDYWNKALKGKASYHFSHNPMGAAMVYSLLVSLTLTCLLGLLAYSASQQLGPLGNAVPSDWEDGLIRWHSMLGHAVAALVLCHVIGVLWAARVHRENYLLAMITGIRRIPRATPLPADVRLPEITDAEPPRYSRLNDWLAHQHPFIGSLLLMLVVIGIGLPVILFLVGLNRILPAY